MFTILLWYLLLCWILFHITGDCSRIVTGWQLDGVWGKLLKRFDEIRTFLRQLVPRHNIRCMKSVTGNRNLEPVRRVYWRPLAVNFCRYEAQLDNIILVPPKITYQS